MQGRAELGGRGLERRAEAAAVLERLFELRERLVQTSLGEIQAGDLERRVGQVVLAVEGDEERARAPQMPARAIGHVLLAALLEQLPLESARGEQGPSQFEAFSHFRKLLDRLIRQCHVARDIAGAP